MQSKTNVTRRRFLKSTVAGAAVLSTGVWSSTEAKASRAAIQKLNIACIGTANRASNDVNALKHENLVAMVDIDQNYRNKAAASFPQARIYSDYREMLAKEAGKIDAVMVGTPDHHHAPATIRAIRAGLHVYCEKPLTHTVFEARTIAEAAKKHSVATQMGTQIHAGENYRRVVEMIQAGILGDVTEVHVWVGKDWGGRAGLQPEQAPPAHLDWDLWLGPAPERAFRPGAYHPANWRRWWDFGQGTLGDMACHYMDLPFWALKLRHPTHCEAEGEPVDPETCPHGLIVRYRYPEREGLAPVALTWYDGNKIPKEVAGERVPGSGIMFVGTEGKMFADYGKNRLFPAEKFAAVPRPEKTIPPTIGHHKEWIKACKDGSPTTCNFDYSGALTESVLLGNVAYRAGKALEWDAANLKATNCPEADQYITKNYRPGWEVE